jgi:hypothetical protein
MFRSFPGPGEASVGGAKIGDAVEVIVIKADKERARYP